MPALRIFKPLRRPLQKIADRKMLRTDVLALTASDTVGRLAALPRYPAVAVVRTVRELDAVVHDAEDPRDVDLHRAAVRAVPAAGAFDELQRVHHCADLCDRAVRRLRKRLRVLHERDVLPHLLHGVHAGKHHHDPILLRSEPQRDLRRRTLVQRFERFERRVRQKDQSAAFDRLHDKRGLVVLSEDVHAPLRLHVRVVEVEIVILDLHDLDLRMLCENAVQKFRRIVERHADMLHFALLFELLHDLERMTVHVFLIISLQNGVDEVEIEILHAAGGKLRFKKREDVLFVFKAARGQLVREHVAIPRVAACEPLPKCDLALSLIIHVRRVEIIEARVQIAVHHRAEVVHIHVAVPVELHPHAAEREFAPQKLRKPFHVKASLPYSL